MLQLVAETHAKLPAVLQLVAEQQLLAVLHQLAVVTQLAETVAAKAVAAVVASKCQSFVCLSSRCQNCVFASARLADAASHLAVLQLVAATHVKLLAVLQLVAV